MTIEEIEELIAKKGSITAGVFDSNREVDLKKIKKTMRATKGEHHGKF